MNMSRGFLTLAVALLLAMGTMAQTNSVTVSPNGTISQTKAAAPTAEFSVLLPDAPFPDADATNGNWPVALINTRHGRMLVIRHDVPVATSLAHYGQWEQKHLDVLVSNLKEGDVVLDVGGHIGTFALAFANAVGPSGKVISFEPQPLMHKLLVSNAILNGHNQVEAHQWAAGAVHETIDTPLPDLDPNKQVCLACLELDGRAFHTGATQASTHVPVVPIDTLNVEKLSLVKVDVEGFEIYALLGAYNTLMQHRDSIVLSVENNRDKTVIVPALLLDAMGFNIYFLQEKCHQDDAFRNGHHVLFKNMCGVMNSICITGEAPLSRWNVVGQMAEVCQHWNVQCESLTVPMDAMVKFMYQQAEWSTAQGIPRWATVWQRAADRAVVSFLGSKRPLPTGPPLLVPQPRTQPLIGPLPFASFLQKLADFVGEYQNNAAAKAVLLELATTLINF